jgi:sugar O-acyltransferase (sialic acid O-acetyltransferase NeuD family)
MAERRLLVIGAGAHARAVADVALACGWGGAGFVAAPGAPVSAPGVVGSDDDLPRLVASRTFDGAVVGVGNAVLARRPTLFARLRELRIATPSLVHPSAVVSPSARIGGGSVVFPQVTVGADVLVGEDAVLYSGSIVEHDCRIGDHAYLAPGVILCGNVRVDSGAFLGAGAIVVPGVVIGKEASVPAGARVAGDVAARTKLVGSKEHR